MIEKNRSQEPSFLKIVTYVAKHGFAQEGIVYAILTYIVLMMAMIALSSTIPLLFKYSISLFETNPEPWFIQAVFFAYSGAWLLNQIITQTRTFLINRSIERSSAALSMAIFNHLHRLSLRFHAERHTGKVIHTVLKAQQAIESLFWSLFLFLLPPLIEVAVVAAILYYLYGVFYAFFLVALCFLYCLGSTWGLQWAQKAYELYKDKRSSSHGFFTDSLLNAETVKYFTNQLYECNQYSHLLKDQTESLHAYTTRSFISYLLQSCIMGVALCVLTWYSGHAVTSKTFHISDYVLINGYLLQFISPLMHFGHLIQQVRRGVADMSELMKLLEKSPEIEDIPGARELEPGDASVTFDHVSFFYDAPRHVVRDITVSIPAGKTVALVGATGSGKSTISRLLFRLYDVTAGRICINGYDIKTVTQQSLHKLIGIVPQDTVLFNNTIAYNIAYGKPGASFEDIKCAARLAHLEEFIQSLPDGYNTMVGERGVKLSGGEKQRVALARVILKKPSIYIFDEATSALDSSTEKEIQRNILELSVGATTLIIAHRLSTIIHADEILVLDQGAIVERGSHEELLKKNSLYAGLWKDQTASSSLDNNYMPRYTRPGNRIESIR